MPPGHTDMETIMDNDTLKSAWQDLNRRIERHDWINLQLLRERRLDKARASLRQMYWGKIVQILFGDALIYFAVTTGIGYRAQPHLLACSAFILAYGVLTLVFSGVTLGKISNIDYTAPVLDIQKRLVALRRIHGIGNRWLGLPWWFLWIAIFVLEMKANVGVDLFVTMPAFIWTSGAIGAVGLIATLGFLRRRRRRLGDTTHEGPRSLRAAENALDELTAFEGQ